MMVIRRMLLLLHKRRGWQIIISFQKKEKNLWGRKKMTASILNSLNISLSFEEKLVDVYVQKAAKEKFVKFLILA